MSLNLSNLFKSKSIANIQTDIGELFIFSIRMRDNTDLLKEINSPLENILSDKYLKHLIIYVCYPESSLEEGKNRPKKPVLTLNDVDNLSKEDLEHIAELYINSNEYLFKKHEFKKRTDESGKEINYSEYTDVEHPKDNEESYISYLHRLACFEQKKQKDRMKDVLGSMPNISSFSNSLSNGITQNLMFGNSLSQQLATDPTMLSRRANIDYEELHRNREELNRSIEEARRAPFDDLANRLDKLIYSSTQASEFMVEANKIQTEIATEIKVGGDTTDLHSRNNIKLSFIVIVLTVLSLIFTGWASFSGVSFSQGQQDIIQKNASNLSNSISKSAELVQESENQSQAILLNILESLNELNVNYSSQKKELDVALSEVKKLKSSNIQYLNKLEVLNTEIQMLKASGKSEQRPNK